MPRRPITGALVLPTRIAPALSTLRLDHAQWDGHVGDYERNAETESIYLGGLGRVLYANMPQIDGDKPSSLAELALFLPVQIIDPEVHHLIEEGPSRRRRFWIARA